MVCFISKKNLEGKKKKNLQLYLWLSIGTVRKTERLWVGGFTPSSVGLSKRLSEGREGGQRDRGASRFLRVLAVYSEGHREG